MPSTKVRGGSQRVNLARGEHPVGGRRHLPLVALSDCPVTASSSRRVPARTWGSGGVGEASPSSPAGPVRSGVPHRGDGAVRNAGSGRAGAVLVLAFLTAAIAR